MSRPDPAPRRPRDPRLDAFRGLALAMIFIDHIPGNPYESLTLKNLGFSDAAEAFFLMSGIAAGLAYAGRFAAAGGAGGIGAALPMWRRARVLYVTHLMLTACVIAIFAAAALAFEAPELLKKHNLGGVFAAPLTTLPAIPLLGHQIGYVNILPVYCLLLLAAPGAIWLGLRRPLWLFAGSLALWAGAGVLRLNLPNFPQGGGWFFNPLSWQLIFVIGLLSGIALRRGSRWVPRSGWLIGLCVALLLLVLAWRHWPGLGPVLNRGMWLLSEAGAPRFITAHDKTYLALPRLLHALALAYLLSCLPLVRRICAAPLAAPLRTMGRQGLLVFASGTVLALAFQALIMGSGQGDWMHWALPPVGLVLLWAAARRAETGWPRSLGALAVPPLAIPRRRPALERSQGE